MTDLVNPAAVELFGTDAAGDTAGFLRERVTSAFPCITTDEALIHEGLAYTQSEVLTIANTKYGSVRITTPSTSSATAASITFDATAPNADLTITAKTAGAGGNDITVQLNDPGEITAECSVEVVGQAIAVTLSASDGVGTITATAADVKAAIEADADANALVSVVAEGTGLGVVDTQTSQLLTGGSDAAYTYLQSITLQSTAAVTAKLIEGSTVTGTETAREPYNRNRLVDDLDDSSVAVHTCADATISTSGLPQLAAATIPATAQTEFGARKWVLKGGTDYVLSIYNASGGNATVTYSLEWNEQVSA